MDDYLESLISKYSDDIKVSLRELYSISRNKSISKSIRREKIRQLRLSLRSGGILSLPFSINPKKF